VNKIQSISICLIAAVLVGQLYISELHPKLSLYFSNGNYSDAAIQCHQAIAEGKEANYFIRNQTAEISFALKRATEVAMMDCYRRDELRLELLSHGVSPHELDLIELRAKNRALLSLSYFVDGLGGSR
jgi:hypothetical protein